MNKTITIVAAHAKNRAIGVRNKLPWSIRAEMDHFRKTTMGHAILMGSNTARSIGKALPGRKNLVLTSQQKSPIPGMTPVHSLREALAQVEGDELMIIGGESLYREFLPVADRLIISYIDLDVPDADAFFPEIDSSFEHTTTDLRLSNKPDVPHFAIWEFQRKPRHS